MVHVKLDLVSFVKDLKCYICFWNVFNMKLLGSVCSGDFTHPTFSVICIWDALRLFQRFITCSAELFHVCSCIEVLEIL